MDFSLPLVACSLLATAGFDPSFLCGNLDGSSSLFAAAVPNLQAFAMKSLDSVETPGIKEANQHHVTFQLSGPLLRVPWTDLVNGVSGIMPHWNQAIFPFKTHLILTVPKA